MSASEYAAPNAGMATMSVDGGRGLAPCNTASATLVAVGSFTARVPVSVEWVTSEFVPVHPWQPAQAPAKNSRPLAFSSMATPCDGSGGAGCAFGAGKSTLETGGTLRTYSAMAWMSDGVIFAKLKCTASAIGPNAEPRSMEWPVVR